MIIETCLQAFAHSCASLGAQNPLGSICIEVQKVGQDTSALFALVCCCNLLFLTCHCRNQPSSILGNVSCLRFLAQGCLDLAVATRRDETYANCNPYHSPFCIRILLSNTCHILFLKHDLEHFFWPNFEGFYISGYGSHIDSKRFVKKTATSLSTASWFGLIKCFDVWVSRFENHNI